VNTPAHLLVNLAAWSGLAARVPGAERAEVARWVAAGALLPDLPMFGFYAWQRIVRDASEHAIWRSAYFEEDWQLLFDAFNSIPLFGALGVAALVLRRAAPAWLCASALLHCLCDAFVHRDDGHRHLWPLADWRFLSPVSYWDPAHHGALGAGVETLLVAVAAAALWGRAGRTGRAALAGVALLQTAGWVAFYLCGVPF